MTTGLGKQFPKDFSSYGSSSPQASRASYKCRVSPTPQPRTGSQVHLRPRSSTGTTSGSHTMPSRRHNALGATRSTCGNTRGIGCVIPAYGTSSLYYEYPAITASLCLHGTCSSRTTTSPSAPLTATCSRRRRSTCSISRGAGRQREGSAGRRAHATFDNS